MDGFTCEEYALHILEKALGEFPAAVDGEAEGAPHPGYHGTLHAGRHLNKQGGRSSDLIQSPSLLAPIYWLGAHGKRESLPGQAISVIRVAVISLKVLNPLLTMKPNDI